MRKSAVKNDVSASTLRGTKNTKISKDAKSPAVLKSSKASLKERSTKKTYAKNSKKTDR